MAILYYRDLAKNQWVPLVVPTVVGSSDHGLLVGLDDDDHPQYLTVARGDARYPQIEHTHPYAPLAHSHAIEDLPTTLATDAEVGAAIGNHEIKANPHGQYALSANVPNRTGGGASGTWPISVTGNANTATAAGRLSVGRSIGLTGDVLGAAYFDGTSDVQINATVVDNSHNHSDFFTDGQVAYEAGWDAYSLSVARSGNIVSFNALFKRTGANATFGRNVQNPICTLPVGFRPNALATAPAILLANTSPAWQMARFSFEMNGVVQFMVNPASGINTDQWILVNASWRAR